MTWLLCESVGSAVCGADRDMGFVLTHRPPTDLTVHQPFVLIEANISHKKLWSEDHF